MPLIMFKKLISMRNVVAIAICLAGISMFSSCVKSSEKLILSFSITTPAAVGIIDEVAKTVTVTVPAGTDLIALIPTIVVSEKAMVSPESGVATNFTNPIKYTVTAEDGTTAEYIVTVTAGAVIPDGDPQELTSPITVNTTLKDLGLPIDYFYTGTLSLKVQNNAILTIEPGVCIQFRGEGGLAIEDGSTIKAEGTADKHIKFIGATTDKGSWSEIVIYSVTANTMDYVEILNGGGENLDRSAALYLNNGKLSLTNSLIDRSSRNGITLEGSSGNQAAELVVFSNNTISNCDKAPIFTYRYCGTYSLRNIANNNIYTNNTNEYIHISTDLNTEIQADMTIPHQNGYPWYLQEGLRIEYDRNVTIAPGAVILLGAGMRIYIDWDSHLIAEGTVSKRITIKGFKDNVGYWEEIQVHSQTPGTKFIYCDISGGGNSTYECLLYMYSGAWDDSYVALDNTTFSNSLHYGLHLEQYNTDSHCYVSSTTPSSVTFSQCPDGNIYTNSFGPYGVYDDLSSAGVLH